MTRFIQNIFDPPDKLASYVTDQWILQQTEILSKYIDQQIKQNPNELDSGNPYTGESGVSYAFMYSALHMGGSLLERARILLNEATKSKSPHNRKNSRFLTGHIGTLTVMAGDSQSNTKEIEEEIKQLGQKFINDDSDVENEVLNGRSGFLCSVLWLRKTVNRDMFSDAESKRMIEQICHLLLYRGARTSDKNSEKDPPPLMYYWHDTMYIGAAHGLAGILLALLSLYNDFSDCGDPHIQKKYPHGLKSRIKETVDWLISIQTADGGFASSLDYVSNPKSYDLVHWCHGAPGIIPTLLKAYQVFHDTKYLQAAELGGEQVWEKGILRKGPGLCHGISGNGYTFLFLWKATGDLKWLNRAKAFAYLMMSADIQKQQKTPDHPCSLYEGWSGGLAFLINLLPSHVNSPRFPLYPYFD